MPHPLALSTANVSVLRVRVLNWSYLRQNDDPLIAFRKQDHTHSVHPDPLQAGENRVFPKDSNHQQVARVHKDFLNCVRGVFLGIRGKYRLKFLTDLLAIPSFSMDVHKSRILGEKIQQLLCLLPFEPGEETLQSIHGSFSWFWLHTHAFSTCDFCQLLSNRFRSDAPSMENCAGKRIVQTQ